jgi:hypothetical protein
MGERRGAYRVLVGKPEGRRPLGKPRGTWEDNTKMDLREVGWSMAGSVLLMIGTGGGCCERGNEPSSSIKCGQFLEQLRICWLLKKESAPWR